jgi:hypothetical protein
MKPASPSFVRSVKDLLPEYYDPSSPVLIIGLAPTTHRVPPKRGTFLRLKKWCDECDLQKFDFCNLYDTPIDQLQEYGRTKKKIIALGVDVARICAKYGIPHFKMDHPSGLNRNLNDPKYEQAVVHMMKEYLNAR